jgi:hypothetical protein
MYSYRLAYMFTFASYVQGNADAKQEFDTISALGPGNGKEDKKRVILRAWCSY